jgi:hypothetical protein
MYGAAIPKCFLPLFIYVTTIYINAERGPPFARTLCNPNKIIPWAHLELTYCYLPLPRLLQSSTITQSLLK